MAAMRVGLTLALGVAAAGTARSAAAGQVPAAPAEVRFPVRDSLEVVADIHRSGGGPGAPAILLFHQGGGSARGEYRSITPRLLREGYNVVAADVRGGGTRFGDPNRAPPVPEGFSYCDAASEVDATVNLARAHGFTGPLVLWGSSYTAALVLQVAVRRSADVRAVLAFSPASGEPMRGCEPEVYVAWLRRAGVPALVLRPRAEIEDTARAARLEAMRRDGAHVFVAEEAVHGSSMLDGERSPGDTGPQWNAVLALLRRSLEAVRPTAGERAVTIPSGGWTLHGDLRLPPNRPAPVAVLLHKAAGSRAIYRDLAGRLADAGIGSLRVDLRGHGESVGLGRFIPGRSGADLGGTDADVAAILRFVRTTAGVDTARLAIVGGSYSSEAAAKAVKAGEAVRAQVALSPGDFSDQSFRAAEADPADWLFVRSDNERFVREWLDAKARELAPSAELWVLPAGSAHATDLLVADSTLGARLTAWLTGRLRPGQAALPTLTYLANEGVMLQGRGGRVFIDALFGDGLPQYAALPPGLRDSLERARPGFDGPALVLATHAHRDHHDAAALARYLASNPRARRLGPPDAGAPADSLDLGWVRAEGLALPHGHTVRPVGHAAWLVTLDGVTALHIGDTSSEPDTWPGLGLPRAGVDLALVPYWYALDEARFARVLEITRAGTVVLLHAPLGPEGDRLRSRGGWEAWSADLRRRYPAVATPSQPGTMVAYQRRSSTSR